ncbi:hypothetical protein NPIL_290651 [Nephila pilipes]|uniref:Uncharacterized protein n=1 Tax=Nephila pilipes TaxID=299642 RepID=A0A8X6URT8_NEPPI|nr:hypothetical protein NPIL_290651 [Nephila pilipes]
MGALLKASERGNELRVIDGRASEQAALFGEEAAVSGIPHVNGNEQEFPGKVDLKRKPFVKQIGSKNEE